MYFVLTFYVGRRVLVSVAERGFGGVGRLLRRRGVSRPSAWVDAMLDLVHRHVGEGVGGFVVGHGSVGVGVNEVAARTAAAGPGDGS